MNATRSHLNTNGFCIIPKLLSALEIETLLLALSNIQPTQAARQKTGTYAIRNLLHAVPEVAALADSPPVKALVTKALGPSARPVRGTLFDKTPEANWLVPWHQDLTICVQHRADLPGYGPWTVKAGVHHVQPPVEILKAMLAVRIHLDDCHSANGPLRILPGTHRRGRLTAEEIEQAQHRQAPVTCTVNQGGALLMKPLVLHASSAAQQPGHRRIIHIDFAACNLPSGLNWLPPDL